ncbi:MAG: (deoxy)nucleoside triphosphate pyrophosphohydrolase [Proteobacteria bacterium]|nr:(deoxy)nucleoside triphosphate pyrophosphohydrolase [Pseudomonadota bacterium]
MPQSSVKEINVVAAVITDNIGRILVTQRGEGMDFTGKWEFPGGKVNEGEGLRTALKREIREELMLDIEISEEVLTWQYNYPFSNVKFTAFKATIKGGTLKLMEHMDFQWVQDVKALETLDWVPADKNLVAALNI